jgi:hypothetical protein
MNGSKIFLGISVLIWLPYGIWCSIQPGYLAEVAGLVGSTATGTTEIRAMYGGLQAGIGALCLAALMRPQLVQPALVAICFLTGGLAAVRFIGLFVDSSASSYTVGALIFEIINTSVAVFFARKSLAESASREGLPAAS